MLSKSLFSFTGTFLKGKSFCVRSEYTYEYEEEGEEEAAFPSLTKELVCEQPQRIA